jgi:hypothetical protein
VAAFESVREGGNAGGFLNGDMPQKVGQVPGIRGTLAADAAFGIEQYRRLIEASDDPAEAIEVAREIDRLVVERPVYAVLSKTLFPSLVRAIQLDLRGEMLIRCARAALAAERYRIDHGRYPAALDDLVPDNLDAIPIDAFDDGRPLKYRVDDEGVTIYSVDINGTDDGGDLEWRKDGTGQPDSGFRLLKPDLRGRPAPVETQPADNGFAETQPEGLEAQEQAVP